MTNNIKLKKLKIILLNELGISVEKLTRPKLLKIWITE